MKNNRELLGYVLQKDFFDCKKGTLFYRVGRDKALERRVILSEKQQYVYFCNPSSGNWVFNDFHVENFPKWFKAVYK